MVKTEENHPLEGAGRKRASAIERVFIVEHPAEVMMFDMAGASGRGKGMSLWSLANRYAMIFSAAGELAPQKKRDTFDPRQFDRELATFGQPHDSWRMRIIRKQEAERMAEIFFSPSMDVSEIEYTQKVLDHFISSPDLDELISLKNRAYRMLAGVSDLVGSCGDEFNEESLVSRYNRKEEYFKSYESGYPWGPYKKVKVTPLVIRAVRKIANGVNAIHALSQSQDADVRNFITGDMGMGFTRPTLRKLRELYKELEGHPYIEEFRLENFKRAFERRFMRFGAMLELAKKIRDEHWTRVTFDETRPYGYTQGRNIERRAQGQRLNDSTADTPVIVLSGANTSGKSFFMRSDMLIRVAAQSLGYAPAESANLPLSGGFFLLDRSASDSANDLSAFMQEVAHWNNILPLIKDNTRMYVDEGYSTTSAVDQADLLRATAAYVTRRGGTIMLATHNNLVIDALANGQESRVYHLAVDIDKNGELVRHFRLEEGVGDSLAFAAARKRKLSPGTLAFAEGYTRGERIFPVPLAARAYRRVEAYSPRAREQKKREVASLSHLFPDKPVRNVFHLYSMDGDFQVRRFLRYVVDPEDEKIEEFGMLLPGKQKELLSQMILWAPACSSEDVLERQKMVSELQNPDLVEKLQSVLAEAREFEAAFFSLIQKKDEGINKGLNPISVDIDTDNNVAKRLPYFSRQRLDEALAFLRIHEKLLPNNDEITRFIHGFTAIAMAYDSACERLKDEYGPNHDTPLTADEVMLVLWDGEQAGNGAPTFRDLEMQARRLFRELGLLNQRLPVVSYDSIPIDEIREDLLILGKEDINIAQHLHDISQQEDRARALVSLLQTVDSVYLNQAAHLLSQQVDLMNAVLRGTVPVDAIRQQMVGMRLQKKFEHTDIQDTSLYSLVSLLNRKENTVYGETLDQLNSICLLAKTVNKKGFVPVQFNQTGELRLYGVLSIFKKKEDEVANTVALSAQDERVQLLTGPNGSGKTFYQKSAVAAILWGMATGYAPAQYATMPLFDAVAYLDRVTLKQNNELSAFSQEVEYWKNLFGLLDKKRTIFAAVDEAFSTTSPSYQAGLTYAAASEFLTRRHFLMLATHNHDVVDTFEQSAVRFVYPHHFQYAITDEGKIHYSYVIARGHEPSHAKEVARTMGLPEEITDGVV